MSTAREYPRLRAGNRNRMDARFERTEANWKYAPCPHCGDSPIRHEQRCTSAVFREGVVMRCLRDRHEDGEHVYRESQPTGGMIQ